MKAIYKRELKAFFTSATAYVFGATFLFASGLLFAYTSILTAWSDITTYFKYIKIAMFFLPLLTMRLFSEERKLKTDQALLTAPVGLFSVVFGKFLAAFTVYAMTLGVTLLYPLLHLIYGKVDLLVLAGQYLGALLLGGAIIAVGIFLSSLTENQVIAAVSSFTAVLFLLLATALVDIVKVPVLVVIANYLTLFLKFNDFVLGIFNFSNVIYYISFAAIFIFLTIRLMEKRRWE